MRPVVFDSLARWFLRSQATLVMWPMAALPLADHDAELAFFCAAVATDAARWALSRFRRLPLATGGALVCCALALGAAAVVGGAGSPPLPVPSPDHDGAPLFDPRSGFLAGVEAAGGGGFLLSLLVAMCAGQAGVFLAFAGERSAYIRRHGLAERPERLALRGVMAFFGLQLFFVWVPMFALWAGLLIQGAPANPAAALDQAVWRIVTAGRFLIPSAAVGAAAMMAWMLLSVNASQRELRRKAMAAIAGKEPERCGEASDLA